MVQNFIITSSHCYPEELESHFDPDNYDEYIKNKSYLLKTSEEIKSVISIYRAGYINEEFIELIYETFGDEDFLFVPIKTPDGFIFLPHQIFNKYDDDQIAKYINDKGGMDISYNLSEGNLYVLHANFGYLNCFQFKGKYDYADLGKKILRKYDAEDITVCGRFTADFITEDGEDYSVDEIILQAYEAGHPHPGYGWESDKIDENGNFQVEREVEERNIGEGALNGLFRDSESNVRVNVNEVEKWFDADYVAENAITIL